MTDKVCSTKPNTHLVKNNSLINRLWRQRWLWMMVLPGILFVLVFNYIPMSGLILIFRNASTFTGAFGNKWVGFDNFKFLQDPEFHQVFFNTIRIAFWKLVFTFIAPLVLALLLNEVTNLKFKRSVQTLTYLPYFISWVVVAGLFDHLLSVQTGIVNDFIKLFGAEPIFFLGDTKTFIPVIVVSAVWKTVGFSCIIYLASISSISVELYEAAYSDGAGRLAQLRHITLPGIMPTITILLVLAAPSLVNAGFDQIYLFQNPLNIKVSDIIESYVLRMGLGSGMYSYSAAIGILNSILSTTLLLLVNTISKRSGGSGIW